MTTTHNSTITNDISFTLLTTGGGQSQSESSSLAYQQALANGTGVLQANYGVAGSGDIPAGDKVYLDFRELEKVVFNTSSTVQFSRIKGIAIENTNPTGGEDLRVYATGTNALDTVLQASANFDIKPYGVFSYADPISGSLCDATTREITIENLGTKTTTYQIITVGITG